MMGAHNDAWNMYLRAQYFKKQRSSVISGINYANVVAFYLYDDSAGRCIKQIIFSFFFGTRIVSSGDQKKLLNFYSHRYKRRPDYDYIAEKLVSIAGEHGDAAESDERFSPTQFCRTLREIRIAWKASVGYKSPRLQRLAVTALIAKYLSVARHCYSDLLENRSVVVTFCDAAPHDNLLAQLARQRRALTLTAQHGQYRLLNQDNMSTDAEAYSNFVSDQLLCWGEATCAEFERYGVSRERMNVTGWIRSWDRMSSDGADLNTFGVMLNGDNGAESNLRLIEAAKRISCELDYRYVVRLHPAHAVDRYISHMDARCHSIGVIPAAKYSPIVAFSIAHMSGATIEMLQMESPVYALDDGQLADAFRVPGLSFLDTGELLEAIREDLASSDRGRARARHLKQWFNDDRDQESRILSAMLSKGT